MKATALKPPGQSMNAKQNKDDRRHYSTKMTVATTQQQPSSYTSSKLPAGRMRVIITITVL